MLTMTLQLVTAAMIGQFSVGPPMPLDVDHLKAPFGEKHVELILDVSGSMADSEQNANCPWFESQANNAPYYFNVDNSNNNLNKMEQLKAALVGCAFASDGILDAWSGQVDFGITAFGQRFPPYVEQKMGGTFTRNLTALENEVLQFTPSGSTPMMWGVLEGGKAHNDYWSQPHPNEFECDQHFNVLMTDGFPNDCGDDGMGGARCATPAYNQVPCGAGQAFNPFVPPPGTPFSFSPPFGYYNGCVVPSNCDVVGAAGYYQYLGSDLPDSVCRQAITPSGSTCLTNADCNIVIGETCTSGQCILSNGEDGVQNITTYAIGFGDPTQLDENLLRAVAARGGGRYYGAQSATALSSAFSEILNAIITRTANFAPPSIQTDGLYVGNDSYSAAFKAQSGRPWIGNLKRYCVNPQLSGGVYQTEVANNDCLFVHRNPPAGYPGIAGTYLETNSDPLDPWSGSRSLEADSGGAGFRVLQDYFGGHAPYYNAGSSAAFTALFGGMSDPAGTTQNDFYNTSHARRKIITWDPASGNYVDLYTLSDSQLYASGCQRTRLLSYLYGYDANTVDCMNQVPTQIGAWPLGAAVNAHPTIIRWGASCTAAANQCLVALNMDDGGIHFFDTFDGHEHSVLVPHELLTPGSTANYPLASILDQPMRELSRRPYLDGPMFRVHDDKNANGIIDGTETAFLVWGLGHSGGAYYFMDIHTPFPSIGPGVHMTPNATLNPVYPLVTTPGLWTENLRNSMAQPLITRVRYSATNPPVLTAVIPSGHVWYMDRPDEAFNTDAGGLKPPFDPALSTTANCAAFAAYNGLGSGNLCTAGYLPPLWIALGIYLDIGITGGCGLPANDRRSPPLWFGVGGQIAGGITRITFSNFDLDPGDYLVLEDLAGHEISPRLTGVGLASIAASTIYNWDVMVTARPFIVRLHADGVCTTNSGVAIQSFSWLPDRLFGGCGGGNPCAGCDVNGNGNCTNNECGPGSTQAAQLACALCDGHGQNSNNNNCQGACTPNDGSCTGNECNHVSAGGSCGIHNPFIAFIDMTRINGPAQVSSSPPTQQFATQVQNGSAPLLFTRACPAAASGFTGRCYEASTPQGAGASVGTGDLQYMQCPILAEVRGYEEGGVGKAFYVGDQCGQMWKLWTENNGDDWNAKRLFSVNDMSRIGYESRTYRHFDRPVDLVLSQCRGNRSIGVYFGTGNTARPSALDNLEIPVGQADAVTLANSSLIRNVARVRNHNVMGTFFDSGQWNAGASRTLADFQDVTPANLTEFPVPYNRANDGWFWALRDDEQMLRDPLVFQGAAYFKTNQGITAVTTCKPGTTTDRVYAVDNCTSLPSLRTNYLDNNGNNITPTTGTAGREVWVGQQDIGGNLLLYTPKDGPPIVSVGDTSAPVGSSGNLIPPKANVRTLEMLMRWRVF